MKYALIGDEDTVLGFAVVGVTGKVATTADEAHIAFQEFLADKDIAIVIMTERIADLMRSVVDQYLLKENFPLIVEIPDRKGALPNRPGIKERVNAAIGIKI